MDSRGAARKRGRVADAALNGGSGAVGLKKVKVFSTWYRKQKSKPCTKFFSTSGCPFGRVVTSSTMSLGASTREPYEQPGQPHCKEPMAALPHSDGPLPPPAVKTRMCNKYGTTEGCKFGDKCHFAHGERELGMPILPTTRPGGQPVGGKLRGLRHRQDQRGRLPCRSNHRQGRVNTKQICRITGAKLAIREHEADSTLRNIELEGTFDQIKQASAMVRELILNLTAGTPLPNYKTKMCENFGKGSCTFGARCHFAHGAADLRKPTI
ncbi:unnamed protein product [Spirodela intermedia]|uniref:C3H1-type domain-containing protein n=1 Tax=Spirodela intermedia TaxID=51605 RepID=A0A7I8JK04_SPIIN|nr:unnamed protein product [Spirodela intermedia]CAA6670191.1 unnamed protein product [Spirodela intermedia]